DISLDDLREMGYPEIVVTGIDAVSKRPGELYPDLVRRAAKHPIGGKVKKADILDNFSPMRRYNLAPNHRNRLAKKYSEALEILRTKELEMEFFEG
ncbi:MAG: guanosine-3',5'-bis(diphosphate) 3'-pyrophosphohydrolase, partial [Dehalococcoidia bacterium]